MLIGHAVVAFDVAVLAVLTLDFIVASRTSAAIVPRIPAVSLTLVLVALASRVTDRPGEFVVIGSVVLGAALFGYANFLAFVKRGITFSILVNHARPPRDRIQDSDFIALEERIMEMRSHGWIEDADGGWRLTSRGRRVVRVRRALLRALRIEAVG